MHSGHYYFTTVVTNIKHRMHSGHYYFTTVVTNIKQNVAVFFIASFVFQRKREEANISAVIWLPPSFCQKLSFCDALLPFHCGTSNNNINKKIYLVKKIRLCLKPRNYNPQWKNAVRLNLSSMEIQKLYSVRLNLSSMEIQKLYSTGKSNKENQ